MCHDGVPNFAQSAVIRMPHTAGHKHHPGLDVQVKPRRMHISARFMAKLRAYVRFVGAFVFCKADIAINAKQGAAIGARVGDEAGANGAQVWLEVADKTPHGIPNVGLIALLIGLKPCSIVVPA
jgi:hypothetical protein